MGLVNEWGVWRVGRCSVTYCWKAAAWCGGKSLGLGARESSLFTVLLLAVQP